MSEPSTDEREARAKTLREAFDAAFMEALDRGAGRDERLDVAIAAALATRPAVDVEGIARMIFAHEESTSVGDEMHCNGCGEVIDGGDLNLDQARHQAAAVVAYLAGESHV